jgi:RNA polymerase primary sigma factor
MTATLQSQPGRADAPATVEIDLPAGKGRHKYHYIHHPTFSLPATENYLWGPDSEKIEVPPYTLLPEMDVESHGRRSARRTLTPSQERRLFLRCNYAKYRLNQLDQRRATPARKRDAERWRRRALDVRATLVHANLPLVPAMAKRKRVEGVDFADKVSEGYMAIVRCVEHFDASRGFKFSTYACRAILACLGRLGSKEQTYRKHVPTQFEPAFEKDDYGERRHEEQRGDAIESVRQVLKHNDAGLNDTEEEIIRKRYPIGGDGSLRPLWRIGRDLGISTERVRQIEKASLRKLGNAVDHMLA